jgi:hypothetical protein
MQACPQLAASLFPIAPLRDQVRTHTHTHTHTHTQTRLHIHTHTHTHTPVGVGGIDALGGEVVELLEVGVHYNLLLISILERLAARQRLVRARDDRWGGERAKEREGECVSEKEREREREREREEYYI